MGVIIFGTSLIISSSAQGINNLTMLLKAFSSPKITIAESGSEVRRILSENDYDVIIINSPLSDEFGHELAIKSAADSVSGVIIICKNEIADNVSEKVEDYGEFCCF